MADLYDIKDRSPNEQTIAHLKQLLEWAEQGKLRSVFAVTQWDDDSVSHGWSVDGRTGRRRLIGQIELAKFDLLTDTAAGDSDFRLSQVLMGE